MKALILVDIQNDFLPGGALTVPEGDAVIPVANKLQSAFPLVVATQDWHPANHGSFAASHPGRKVFEQIELNGLPQTLWPVHCVQGTCADTTKMNSGPRWRKSSRLTRNPLYPWRRSRPVCSVIKPTWLAPFPTWLPRS